MSASALASAMLLVAACDSAGSGSGGPGGVSEGEARALDEAAEMLEERQLPEGVLPETGADAVDPQDTPQESEEE